MIMGPRILIPADCRCGSIMRWRRHGVLRRRWRLECFCGRCGPWLAHPVTARANPFQRQVLPDAETPLHRDPKSAGISGEKPQVEC